MFKARDINKTEIRCNGIRSVSGEEIDNNKFKAIYLYDDGSSVELIYANIDNLRIDCGRLQKLDAFV